MECVKRKGEGESGEGDERALEGEEKWIMNGER